MYNGCTTHAFILLPPVDFCLAIFNTNQNREQSLYVCACVCVCVCLPVCVCELKLNMERDMCCRLLTPIEGSGACSMHNLLTNKLLTASPRESGERGERAHCTSIYFVKRETEREINFHQKTKNMRKLFRCLVDRRAHLQQGNC